jgi:hypothetical protein
MGNTRGPPLLGVQVTIILNLSLFNASSVPLEAPPVRRSHLTVAPEIANVPTTLLVTVEPVLLRATADTPVIVVAELISPSLKSITQLGFPLEDFTIRP